ncbi:MAG: hypothetical protein KGJ43_04950 [Acidobacteriota bacterium]|nr:hypothetical protein [Acidobacteriota bacterium]
MSDWQERITHDTAPSIRAEHELRYALAAPLVSTSAAWADLGCGDGIAAARALGSDRPGEMILVDVDAETVSSAVRELAIPQAQALTADLTDPRALSDIEARLKAADGNRTVTCFEVIEHLASFVPIVEWSTRLAREGIATFLISVPNDEFWAVQNPHHLTSWGPGAFAELSLLLPAEHTLLRQVALSGSALCGWDLEPADRDLAVTVGGPGTVASHFIAAYGPRHSELRGRAVAAQSDVIAQRHWERQRENDIAVMQRLAGEHEGEVAKLNAELAEREVWFTEWRTYIQELERELGRPISGAARDELPSADTPPSGVSPGGAPGDHRGDGTP